MAKLSPRRVPNLACLDRPGFGQCVGDIEVDARENPSWLAAMTNQAAHQEAGYT
jgi:hypothetical protein